MTRAEEIILLAREARDGNWIAAAVAIVPIVVAGLTLATCWWLA